MAQSDKAQDKGSKGGYRDLLATILTLLLGVGAGVGAGAVFADSPASDASVSPAIGATATPTPTFMFTSTSTPTPTFTRTPTSTPTPTSGPPCVLNYNVTASTDTIVPGTTFLAGSNCDDCSVALALPFPFSFYGTAFNSVNVISNGSLQFSSTNTDFTNACEPYTAHNNVIHTYWDDYLMTTAGDGVYHSVSGAAPNRILNIEWRACYYNLGSCAGPLNVEARLYETSGRIDVIYGTAGNGNASATGGVQRGTGTLFLQAYCNGVGLPVSAGVMHTYLPGGACPTSTAISTATVTATSTVCPIQFNDVLITNTFYPSVRCLACRGIISGYSDGTFRPNNQVTRGQLAKMVSNAAGFTEPVSGQTFEDVPPTQTFYEWIERLSTRGYMSGYNCGGPGEPCITGKPYFRPSANATRGQTSKIVSNAAGLADPPTGQIFQDVPSTYTFYEFIQLLASNGVMGGYPCGGPGEPCIGPENRPYFRPQLDVTRGQSAKIVANTFYPDCQTP